MNANRRRILVPTDYGPIEVELDWHHLDPLADAVQPSKARLTADRTYGGLDWAAVADVTLAEDLRPVHVVTNLINPLHREAPSDAARHSWSSEALRFINDHITPALILSLIQAGADDWLSLTGRQVAALRRRLAEEAEEQEAHRGAVLVSATAHENDPDVRSAAAALLDTWDGSDDELLAEARRTVARRRQQA